MGAIITRNKPKVAVESSHSQATGTKQDSSAQDDRPTDLKNAVTNFKGSDKAETSRPNQSQDTETITEVNQADREDDLTSVKKPEGSSKAEAAEEPSKSQNTEAIREPDQCDREDDLKNVVTKSEASAKAEATGPNKSQDTEAITEINNQADREDDLSEKGSHTTQDGTEYTTEQKLDILRAKLASYKALYDAGQLLPQGTDDDFCPDYVKKNSEYKSQITDWMVEYCVPELYMKTLEHTTYTTWLGKKSIRVTPYTALNNLYFLIADSTILAERLLASGFMDYAVWNLKDQRYRENCKDNKVVHKVMLRITNILNNCLQLITDHAPYKQLELQQTLKPYLSVENTNIKASVMRIILKVASEEQIKQITDAELEKQRSKMASYKALYDAGQLLPQGTDDDFFPCYVQENSECKSQMVAWMEEYSVPELYMKTLEHTTYTTWLGKKSIRVTPYTALNNLYYFADSTILAERLLASGFLEYAMKNLKDQRYLENYKDNQVVQDVLTWIFAIIKHIVTLVPAHIADKQQGLTQVLKKYLSSDFKYSVSTVIPAVASEEECRALGNTELEEIRAKMESYKHLYDAGDSLPGGSGYELCPRYLLNNPEYQDKAVPWMLEYKVPELFKRTLDSMTSTAIRNDESVYNTCQTILSTLQNITDFSKIIVQKLLDLNYLDYYVNMLTDPKYKENQHEWRSQEVLRLCLGTIHNCVRSVPGHLLYKELQLNKVMKPYLVSDNMVLRAIAMMIYSFVIGEDESKQLDHAVKYYKCAHVVCAQELVDAGLLPLLVKSLQTGPEEELEIIISAKLIWTLSFQEDAKKKVVNEPGLIKELERLSVNRNRDVQKAARGAVWQICGEEKHQQQSLALQQRFENKHIFISYQSDDKQVILQLNQRLKDDGFKTWIDVEQMGGSTLDAMAGAVENAALVLICASEKYKQSANCRTEAAYTYQRGKPLIPLMMQRGFRPGGWLGMLMGVKLYINFDGKYEFEEAYQMLMKAMKPDMDDAPSKATPVKKSADIFLSYEWGSQTQVLALYKALTQVGYSCWMDKHSMGAGSMLYEEMDNGIRACKVLIPCLTAKYFQSINCEREVTLANLIHKDIIPVMLEKMIWPVPGSIGFLLIPKLFVKFSEKEQESWDGPSMDQLLEAISKCT